MTQPQNPYPNLGFNPVPGAVTDVAALQTKISTASDAIFETNTLLMRLRNSNDNVWKGDAGNAFRESFDTTLALDLASAQTSLQNAVRLIQDWHTNLVSFQETARGLETEAAAARTEHTQALATLDQARKNPDLGLARQTFSDPAALQSAQARLDAATAQLSSAATAVNDIKSRVDSIIARARDLETTHNSVAARIAADLDAAAKNCAPSPPDKSIWDNIVDAVKAVGDWIDEHRKGIHDVLSTTAAIAGLLAVVTPPPINAIALGVSLVAGVGALGLDLTDAEMRDDLLHGSWQEKLSAASTISGDALGLIPGAGALGKVGKVALLGDEVADVGRLEGMARAWTEGASNPGIVNKYMTDKNVFGVTDQLNNTGTTQGVHKLLQFTGAEGSHSTPDPAVALNVVKRAENTLGSIGGLALSQIFGG